MSSYDLKSVKLPKLSGISLNLAAKAICHQPTKSLLRPQLLKDAGVDEFRKYPLDFDPVFSPAHRPIRKNRPKTSKEHPPEPDCPTFLRIADYHRAYQEGLSPETLAQVLSQFIQNDKSGHQATHAFVATSAEDIALQAKESAGHFAAGKPRSVLEGVPIAVKDEINQAPYPTRVGTSFIGTPKAEHDSTVVSRLRQAGALLIGKTNMHELGVNPNGFNQNYGTVKNPYNLDHDAGGSSSGSAAAVAAGFCPVAIAADGGGSIRIPASYCGLYGLKPTFGRVSEYGAFPLCWSLAHIGPVASSLDDLATVTKIISGEDSHDLATSSAPALNLDQHHSLEGLRIGVFEPWFRHATDEVVQSCENKLKELESRGAVLVPIEIPNLNFMRVAHLVTIFSEIATALKSYDNAINKVAPTVTINLAFGEALTSCDYVHAQRMRAKALGIFSDLFAKVDVIASPTTAIPSPLIPIRKTTKSNGWSDLTTETEATRYAFAANLCGLPAISLPVAYTGERGLPIGLQLMGSHWEEDLLLSVAYECQREFRLKKPEFHLGRFLDTLV